MASVSVLLAQTMPKRETRRIRGLSWAELRPTGPFTRPKPRRACEKRGIAYEKVVARELRRQQESGSLSGELFISQWILFADSKGTGWAQTDIYIIMEKIILLIECKLTQTDSATPQLLSLYLPLLRKIYNMPIICLQVCKNLRYVPKKFVESPQEFLQFPSPGVSTWHYIGY